MSCKQVLNLAVGDIGKVIFLETGADETGNSPYIKAKPDGAAGKRFPTSGDATPAQRVNDSGKKVWGIEYTTQSGDIDSAGWWSFWAVASSVHGEEFRIEVSEPPAV